MSYCAQSDLLKRISETKLIQLTDDEDAGIIDTDVIEEAIADADAEIDGYCGKRYTLPFTTVPAIILKFSVSITIYNLYGRRKGASEDRRNRYKDAVAFLKGVASGDNSLGEDDPDSTPAAANTPEITQSDRIFTRDKMDGF